MKLITFGVGLELQCCQICYCLPELPQGFVELTTTLITMDKYGIINLFSVIETNIYLVSIFVLILPYFSSERRHKMKILSASHNVAAISLNFPKVVIPKESSLFSIKPELVWKIHQFESQSCVVFVGVLVSWLVSAITDSNLNAFLNPLSANPTKWSNILKQLVGRLLLTNCLSVFCHFVGLALKGLNNT